ncbi:DUF4405 domain-containing protein [Pelosinus propionicus]|uniref:Flavinylation-associated cytochrome domain-containing protein n=1 Tax=Pelosinus propionicus DSM 13327 TaxID=1123291 RepID=A0A1I4IYC3_9FIRM|nr:DUF4405 domain-containing protein [Pelosinus propionicus]SFL59027.1 protein of unknown function [Pelosinus propionicus DSM 13327]
MLSKPEKNYCLDIALLLFGAVSIATGVAISIKPPALMSFLKAINVKSLHEWSSYALTILLMFHLIFHVDWFKAMTRKKIHSKKSTTTIPPS